MRRAAAALAAALLALTAARLWWCGRFELSPDEAYYRLWSQRLDWAYYSKGPGIAAAIRLATWVGGDSERGIRWLSPLLALGTTLLLFLLVREALSPRTAAVTAIALQCVPIFGAGALLMTVDALSAFWWVAAMACGWRALRSDRTSWWLACGAACGLGFLCKYTNVLVLAGIVLACALRPAWRGVFRDRRGAALLLGFLPALVPPVIWNAQRGWPTAHHLLERGGLAREGAWLQPRETLEFVAVHFGTWSPLIFALMIAAVPAMIRRARAEDGALFLVACSAPVLALYSALALHEAGEANWTGPGLLCLLPLAVDHGIRRAEASRPARVLGVTALIAGALLSLVVANTNLVRAAGIDLRAKQDPATRLRGWRETARVVKDAADRAGGPSVVAHHYGLAAELAFYGDFAASTSGAPPVEVVPTLRPKNQFWFWPSDLRVPPLPKRVLYVSDREGPPDPELAWTCMPLEEIPITGLGGTLRVIRVHACMIGADPTP